MNYKKYVAGIALAVMMIIPALGVYAQTSTTTTPGLPNTGASGSSMINTVLLIASGGVLVLGSLMLPKGQKK